MSEVSGRAFSFFVVAERNGACQVDRLLEGLQVTRQELERPGARVPWDLWVQITDRFAEACGSDEALAATCKFALNEGFAGSLGRIAGAFVDPRLFYRVAILWVAQGLYRSVRFTVTEPGPGSVQIDATLLPGFRGSRAWFLLFAHGVPLSPSFLGLPPAEVERLVVSERSALVSLRIAPGRRPRLWTRLRSRWLSGDVVARELVAQQQELTRAFDDMRRATESFRNVLDALPLAVAVVREGHIRYGNPALAGLVGLGVEELKGRSLREFAHPEDVGAVVALERAAGAGGRVRLATAGREEVVLDAQAVGGIDFESEPAVIVIGLDVSQQERARTSLERSEATIRLLISTQPELLIRLDRSLRILDVQPGQGFAEAPLLATMLGRRAQELVALAPAGLASDLGSALAAYEAAAASGQVFERTLLLASETGHPRELHLRVTPVAGGAESILVVRDESRRREAERRLALAEHMASLGVLTAGVAHEINNPLTYVSLTVEALKEELSALPAERQARLSELVAGLQEGTERIRSTVARMKGHSQVAPSVRRAVPPKRAVEAALAIAAHETGRRARVVAELEDTRPVSADETELGQIFINLLVNAAQALDRRPPPGPDGHLITVRLFGEGESVVFECQDTGEGIPPERLGRIFDPFFTTKERKQGTGLGLAIVHRIVRELGGAIDVRSLVGQGSTFRVTLPAAPPGLAAPALAEAPGDAPAARPARVYVVDDEALIRSAVARMLRAWGHEAIPCARAEELLALLRQGDTPDLVLCDLEMPGMTGIDLYHQVQARWPLLAKRFIFLTGGAFTEQALAFVSRPDVRVEGKPVESATLRRLVAEMVGAGPAGGATVTPAPESAPAR